MGKFAEYDAGEWDLDDEGYSVWTASPKTTTSESRSPEHDDSELIDALCTYALRHPSMARRTLEFIVEIENGGDL